MKPTIKNEFSEMVSWDDSDLARVGQLQRALQAQGVSRAEATRQAAETVRAERQARVNQW